MKYGISKCEPVFNNLNDIVLTYKRVTHNLQNCSECTDYL